MSGDVPCDCCGEPGYLADMRWGGSSTWLKEKLKTKCVKFLHKRLLNANVKLIDKS